MNSNPEIREILAKLKEPFPPEAHVERDLPGGQKWFFIPWQLVRERLDEVCPTWECEYGTPVYLDKYCVVSCKLTIAGITRQVLGNAEIELLSRSGKDMSRGSAVERAVADAFKNAAEAFGVAAYLDVQSQDKREFTIRYLHGKGDSRGLQQARSNGWVPGNLPTAEEKRARAQAESRAGASRPAPKSKSESTTRIQTVCSLLGVTPQEVYKNAATPLGLGHLKSAELPSVDADSVIAEICAQWAQGNFKDISASRAAYSELARKTSGLSDGDRTQAWIAEVAANLQAVGG